jgi:hypothetical protein
VQPEAGSAGNALYLAILFKLLALDIIAQGEAAVKAGGEFIAVERFA